MPAREYVLPIKFVIPCFLFTQTLAAYLRNDGNPALGWPARIPSGLQCRSQSRSSRCMWCA